MIKQIFDDGLTYTDPMSWMQQALTQARLGLESGEIPIGAVLVKDGRLLASAHNEREQSKNPLDHAEMLVLTRGAKALADWRLSGTQIYVTLEPCPMCLGALLQARVATLFYGCPDPKRGASSFPSLKGLSSIHGNCHELEINGPILEKECAEILTRFFKTRRKIK